jgi:fructoselysine-6-P-deglycase FrlB-like protein
MIVAAAALLNMASKWAQKSRQARSINDLEEEEEEEADGFEDEFEDEPKHYSNDVIIGEGEGNVEIVETH